MIHKQTRRTISSALLHIKKLKIVALRRRSRIIIITFGLICIGIIASYSIVHAKQSSKYPSQSDSSTQKKSTPITPKASTQVQNAAQESTDATTQQNKPATTTPPTTASTPSKSSAKQPERHIVLSDSSVIIHAGERLGPFTMHMSDNCPALWGIYSGLTQLSVDHVTLKPGYAPSYAYYIRASDALAPGTYTLNTQGRCTLPSPIYYAQVSVTVTNAATFSLHFDTDAADYNGDSLVIPFTIDRHFSDNTPPRLTVYAVNNGAPILPTVYLSSVLTDRGTIVVTAPDNITPGTYTIGIDGVDGFSNRVSDTIVVTIE
jgi:hypothetical protein